MTRYKWLFAALLVLLLVFALWRFDGGSVLESVRQVPIWLVLFLAVLQIISQLLVNTLWHQVARLSNVRISFSRMLYVNCQGAVVDSITPGVKFGGEITRAVQLSRMAGCSARQAASVVALQKLFSLGSLFLIFVFTVGFLANELFIGWHLQLLIYGVLLSFLFVFAGVFLMPQKFTAFLKSKKTPRHKFVRGVIEFLQQLLEQIGTIRRDKKKCALLLLLAFLIWIIYPLKLYLLASLFADASIIQVGASGFAAYMVAMLPLFPGGLGGFEGTLSGLLVSLGFMLNDAAVITVLFRFITFWLVMPASLLYVAVYKGSNCNR